MKKIILSIIIMLTGVLVKAQAVGVGTTTPKAAFNVAANKTVLFGNDTSGAGSKMLWIPSKNAFRAGAVGNQPTYYGYPADSTIWNYDSIGVFSFAAGYQNKAIGLASSTMGFFNEVKGGYATAMGSNNKGNGWYSFSAGANNQSSGSGSVSLGSQNISTGIYSIAAGKENEAAGDNSVALGYQNKSIGDYSAVLGQYNNAAGFASIAIGIDNKVNGDRSYSLGENNTAYGNSSTALGIGNVTNSLGLLALGRNNDTIAGSNRLLWVNTDPLFIIGNGNGGGARKNAMIMLKNGNTGFGTNAPQALMHLKYNSAEGIPHLMLEEPSNDFSRIGFKNSNPWATWEIAAYTHQLLAPTSNSAMNFYYSSIGNVLSLRGNGNAILTGTLLQNSDKSLKKNIMPLKNILPKLMQLNGYHYQWKDSARGKEMQVGFLAQEVEQQFPELVMTDDKGKKSVAYGNMVPVLLAAIKEQQQQIDDLKKLVQDKLK